MFKSKKLVLVAMSVLLVFALLATGCTQKGAENKSGAGDTIKIGVNYELSGPVATYGSSTKDAIMLAIDEINAAGGVNGKKLEPVVYDTKSDPKEALMTATKLITQDKVVALLGPATSGGVKSASAILDKYKVPLIANAATALDVTFDPKTNKVKPFVFRTCFIDPQQATVGAEFTINDLKAKKVAIYYDNSEDYSKGLATVYEEAIKKLGGEVVGKEAYMSDDKEFRPALTKFKNAGAELIYVPGYYQQASLIVSQAREVGLNIPFLGGDGWDSPEMAKIAKDALNNTYFTNHYSVKDPAENVQKFVKAYKAKYGQEPAAFATLGYDATYILADAIKRAGSTDPSAIRDAIEKTKDFQGVTGKYSFDERHNPIKEITVIEIKDGQQTLKTKIVPKAL